MTSVNMEPDQVELIRSSFNKVSPRAPEMVQDFYFRLFVRAPQVRQLFADDVGSQVEKLTKTLAMAVAGADKLAQHEETLSALGAMHAGLGVDAADYDLVIDILLETLAATLGSDWSGDLDYAWRDMLGKISKVMISGSAGRPKVA
jgi:hemoglobin-like flavoprotein